MLVVIREWSKFKLFQVGCDCTDANSMEFTADSYQSDSDVTAIFREGLHVTQDVVSSPVAAGDGTQMVTTDFKFGAAGVYVVCYRPRQHSDSVCPTSTVGKIKVRTVPPTTASPTTATINTQTTFVLSGGFALNTNPYKDSAKIVQYNPARRLSAVGDRRLNKN